MKAYLILITILLASCSGSGNEPTPNNDTGGTAGTGDTIAERYPALVSPTITPNLLVAYDPIQEAGLPEGQQYLDDIRCICAPKFADNIVLILLNG